MRGVFKILQFGMLLMASFPALSQIGGDDQTLVLPLSALQNSTGLTDAGMTRIEQNVNEMARVLTSRGRPSQCLAPIVVNKIDGTKRVVSAQGFLIEPGAHTINGKAILDMTNCPLIDSNPTISATDDLEVDFEAGTTYHVGYFHAPANTAEWKLVVWHIEPLPQE